MSNVLSPSNGRMALHMGDAPRLQLWARRLAAWMFLGLLGYMPLHILLSTWLGTSLHGLELAKILKDIVLIGGFCCAVVASVGTPWFGSLVRHRLVVLIVGYVLWTVIVAMIRPTDMDAEVLGVVYNLRFLVMCIYALLLVRLGEAQDIRRRAIRVVVVVGVVVALFGVAQYSVLPDNILSHLGYSRANGVLPAFFIDDKPDLERVMSTLRDPNSLGSYLIIIGLLLLALGVRARRPGVRVLIMVAGCVVALCLLYTFSRSAWIGAVVALGVFAGLYGVQRAGVIPWLRAHRLLAALVAVVVALGITGVVVVRDSYLVQNVIFHADQSTVLEDPNELRMRFWRESVASSVRVPLGHGPGTAGLASIRNNLQGTVLTENYYLQVLYEVGVIGLALFVAIVALTAWLLYQTYATGRNLFALALVASLAGLVVTNFLVHIWANEAVAYTFWGLAGLYVAVAVPAVDDAGRELRRVTPNYDDGTIAPS